MSRNENTPVYGRTVNILAACRKNTVRTRSVNQQKDSRTVNTPAERGEYEPDQYKYELKQLQSTNTCRVGRGTVAHYILHAELVKMVLAAKFETSLEQLIFPHFYS